MRGDDRQQGAMHSYISPEARVPHDHPLRVIRGLVDNVLRELSPRFEGLYARVGRPSIAPSSCCGPSCSRSCIRSAASGS